MKKTYMMLAAMLILFMTGCGSNGSDPIPAPSSTLKAITAFSLNGVAGTINESGKTISIIMPYGADATNLVATFTTTGSSVKVGSTIQVSGTTANNFTNPVVYTVTAADSSTQDYTVVVTVALSSAKAITAFSLNGVVGTINEVGKTITVTIPYGTGVTNLVATFTTTGASVKVGSTIQVSGTTANNFTSPVTYTVTAADASTQDYTVVVTVALSSAKAITAFSLNGSVGTINETGKTIAVSVPYGTYVMDLVATFTTTGASVKVGSTIQISGTTAHNFTNPVVYTVTAADSSTQDYTVTVTVALSSSKAITAFSLNGVVGTINETGKTIAVAIPYGTDTTNLIATFTTTGASVKVGSTIQVSGTTANNFMSTVTYTVTAADSSTQDYMVTVTVAPTFTFTAVQYKILQPDGTTIILRSRGMGSDPGKAYFDIFIENGLGSVEAFLANPVWYHFDAITAENAINHVITDSEVRGLLASVNNSYYLDMNGGSDMGGKTYQINTAGYVAASTNAITAFNFAAPGAYGIVTEATHTIAVTVPFATDVTTLVPAITHTGASINPASGVSHNFTTPQIYTVTAADATTKAYTVTVTKAPATAAKAITAFTVPTSTVTQITEATHIISVRVPDTTDRTALVPTITHNGASISPNTGVPQNFTGAGGVTYTVTAADSTTQAYVVYVHHDGSVVIHVDTKDGGNIDSGLRTAWDGTYENTKGALFFNGTIYVTNDTAAHMYFTDLRTLLPLQAHVVTNIGSIAGSQDVQPGYTLTRSTYTYTAEKDSGGPWIKDLGSSYPVSFNIQFMDGSSNIQEMRFFPAVSVE